MNIEFSIKQIDWLQVQLSDYEEQHRQTKRTAIEMSKWRV